jgi:hypothetical protein
MEKNTYKRSLFLKIAVWIFYIFCIYGLILDIINNDFYLVFIPIIGIVSLSVYMIIIYVKYIFLNDKIVIKYPFLKEKEYLIENVIGFESQKIILEENWFIIYLNNKKKIKIDVFGKKFKEWLKIFSEKYYKIIKDRNIKTIKTDGFEVNIKKTKYIFFNNRVEVIGKIKKMYYYDKDFESIGYIEIINRYKRMDLLTKDKYVIKLISYECMGGLGLFEYLKDMVKYHNVT